MSIVDEERDAWQQLVMTLELVAELSSKDGEGKMMERLSTKLKASLDAYNGLHAKRQVE